MHSHTSHLPHVGRTSHDDEGAADSHYLPECGVCGQESREVLLQPGRKGGSSGCLGAPREQNMVGPVFCLLGFMQICIPVCKENWERGMEIPEFHVLKYYCPSSTLLFNPPLLPQISCLFSLLRS